jgi:two-component system, sensor histidine kinase
VSDKNRMQQVLLNLLINANKFTQGGSITVYCSKSGEKLKILVKDDGIGIKEQDQDKLFVPFDSNKNNEFVNPGGTGLGLSICKTILNEIGCKIELV